MLFGPAPDIPGECNARLYVGDDYGDNRATFRCEMKAGHRGVHIEVFRGGTCKIIWRHDAREDDDEHEDWVDERHEDAEEEYEESKDAR